MSTSGPQPVTQPETSARKPPAASRGLRLASGLLLSGITLLCLLAGLELVGYLWEKNTAQGPLGWTLVASRRIRLERHGAREQPYYLLHPGDDYLWEGIPVHINGHGFRTAEFQVPKPDGVYRILNLGDSIAFGWEVRQDDTYGVQLEDLLQAQDGSRQWEVINTGIPTWNPEAEKNFLLQEGLGYQPDLVILDVTVVNDIYGRGPQVDTGQTIFQWLRDHTYSWPFLTTQARFLLARQRGPEAIPVLNPPTHASAYYPLEADHPVWDRIWAQYAAILAACQDEGIPVLMVVFPTAFQLNSAAHPAVPQQVLAQRAALAGLPFIDLLPVYAQACTEAGDDACEGYENLLFADVWMHPNAFGHRLAAEQILQYANQVSLVGK